MTRGERAYVWAKACGILGASFLGRRRELLRSVDRPSDLYRLLDDSSQIEGSERDISAETQKRATARSVAAIRGILDSYAHTPILLVRLLRSYEYSDLKQVVAAVAARDVIAPPFTDLGRWSTVRFDAYPDLARMVEGSEFSWIPPSPSESDLPGLMVSFDKRYYSLLWNDLRALGWNEVSGFRALLEEEVALKNVVWSLRMRSYYGARHEALQDFLIDLGPDSTLSTLSWAADGAERALDKRESWRGWRLESLLNPEKPGVFWKLDPRWVQNAASRRLAYKARKLFRKRPFSLDAPAAFIKLMQYEEDLLSATAEGLSLGLSAVETLRVLEAAPC